ncbi:hypothetical protein M513_02484 [Trichuris suis]|uniref:Uncharacterized protein n=1 Tax=Trichuris suis TaxID=68888 RepID=A0A085MHW1_9BILA|nr:hypothetical protein M513_02484 [Trichuris suis]
MTKALPSIRLRIDGVSRNVPVDEEPLATTADEENVIRELDVPSAGLRRSSRLRRARSCACSGT